jgi:hypothetical protein
MMVPNPGFNKGLKQRSKLERLAWAWKGAEKKAVERRLNPMQAINEGRELTRALADKLKSEGIGPKDLAVFAVFAHKDNLGKRAGIVIFDPLDPNSDSNDLESMRKHIGQVPVGFVVCVLHRQSRNFIAHARPIILQKAPLKLLEALVADVANLKDWKLN